MGDDGGLTVCAGATDPELAEARTTSRRDCSMAFFPWYQMRHGGMEALASSARRLTIAGMSARWNASA